MITNHFARTAVNRVFQILVLVALVFAATGCEKFTRQESANLAPFADQTIDLVSTLDYGLTDDDYIYLRKIEDYVDGQQPFDRFAALEKQVGDRLKAMVAYSIEMVRISEQPVSETRKSEKLADIIEQLSEYINQGKPVPSEASDRQALLIKLRSSDDYLESLRMIQPLIDRFVEHSLSVVDDLETEKHKVFTRLEQAVDRKYGTAIDFENELRLVKNVYYKTAIALARYAKTRDTAYIEKMREYGALPVVDYLEGKTRLSNKDMLALHKIINARMAAANENYNYLKPDYDAYYSSHQELKAIFDSKENELKAARLAFVVWGRAYQKMASGKTEPAEWFDISESGALLIGVAGRAIRR
ncbi:MAG TPA: hypothetical protein ENJ11_00785 [Gammaproteobacteria bacterium]|nr:hypothetical protein [Gammaproteobacteria bacterium]